MPSYDTRADTLAIADKAGRLAAERFRLALGVHERYQSGDGDQMTDEIAFGDAIIATSAMLAARVAIERVDADFITAEDLLAVVEAADEVGLLSEQARQVMGENFTESEARTVNQTAAGIDYFSQTTAGEPWTPLQVARAARTMATHPNPHPLAMLGVDILGQLDV